MYVPPAFREDRTEVLHAAIRAASLPVLIGTGPDGLIASHIPMLLDPDAGPLGTLIGHISSAHCHLGNIVTRTGRNVAFSPANESIPNDAEANALLRRKYRTHWATPKGV